MWNEKLKNAIGQVIGKGTKRVMEFLGHCEHTNRDEYKKEVFSSGFLAKRPKWFHSAQNSPPDATILLLFDEKTTAKTLHPVEVRKVLE